MGNKETGKDSNGFVVVIVSMSLCVIISILIVSIYTHFNKTDMQTKTYSSISQFEAKNHIELSLPKEVKSMFNSEIEASIIMGQFIEIYSNEQALLKVSQFMDIKADPLGFYERAVESHEYTVSDPSGIVYLRYRLGYKEFGNCTIINWTDMDKSYGLIVGDVLDESSVLTLLGVDGNNIQYYESSKKEDSDSVKEGYRTYEITQNLSIDLPETNSVVKVENVEAGGYANIYLDDILALIIVYNEESTIDISGNSYKNEDLGIVIKYSDGEQFEFGSEAYSAFMEIRQNIESISSSLSLSWG